MAESPESANGWSEKRELPPKIAETEPLALQQENGDEDDHSQTEQAERLPLTEKVDSAAKENNEGFRGDEEAEAFADEAKAKKSMDTFEIEQTEEGKEEQNILQQISEDVDDLDEEAQGLLAEGPPPKPAGKVYCFCCGPIERFGSCIVFLPTVHARTGWGIMGPHWFGPPCVIGVLMAASSYFIRHAWDRVGPITATICTLWTAMILYLLVNAAYRNPGIVRPDQETPTRQHRWCELCKAYQPPKGAHCPDCNVCIAGFDQYVLLFRWTLLHAQLIL